MKPDLRSNINDNSGNIYSLIPEHGDPILYPTETINTINMIQAENKRLKEIVSVCRANFSNLIREGREHGSSFGEEFSHDAQYCVDLIDGKNPEP